MTKIVAALDQSNYADKIAKIGIHLAKEAVSNLVLAHVSKHPVGYAVERKDYNNSGYTNEDDLMDVIAKLDKFHGNGEEEKDKNIFKLAKSIANDEKFNKIRAKHLLGLVGEELVKCSSDADLIIIGKRGESAEHHVYGDVTIPLREQEQVNTKEFGSNLENLIRASQKPILVVTTNYNLPFKKLVFAYDDSEAAEKLADFLSTAKIFKNFKLHMILVNHHGKESFKNSLEKIKDAGFKVTSDENLDGNLNEIIADYVSENGADLIVAPAFVNSKIHNYILGSMAEKLISQSRTPMLLMS